MANSVRQSNFELMRIFAIILILLNHYVVYGLSNMTLPSSNLYYVFTHFIGGFGKLGVCFFIMITGYFMIDRFSIHCKHIVRIVLDTIFYSWFFLILFLFVFPNYTNFSLMDIYKSILPVSTGGYKWFIKTYLVLYLFIPFINYIFHSCSQKIIKFYLILFGILWYAIPTFSIKINYCFSEFVGFIYLYCLGAYINKYGINFFDKIKNIIIVLLISCSSIIGYLTVCNYLNIHKHGIWLHFSNESSIFTLLIAMSLFYFFKNLNIPYNKYINSIAASVLAVYLIQSDLKDELWTKIFHCCSSSSFEYLIYNILIMVVSMICFSIIFDKLKNRLFMSKLNEIIADSKIVKYIDDNFLDMSSLKNGTTVERERERERE